MQLMTSYHFVPLRWYMDFSFHYRHLLSRRNAKGTKPSGMTIGEIRELRHIEEGPTIQRGRREMGGWPNTATQPSRSLDVCPIGIPNRPVQHDGINIKAAKHGNCFAAYFQKV
jgi:hypothetical protein